MRQVPQKLLVPDSGRATAQLFLIPVILQEIPSAAVSFVAISFLLFSHCAIPGQALNGAVLVDTGTH